MRLTPSSPSKPPPPQGAGCAGSPQPRPRRRRQARVKCRHFNGSRSPARPQEQRTGGEIQPGEGLGGTRPPRGLTPAAGCRGRAATLRTPKLALGTEGPAPVCVWGRASQQQQHLVQCHLSPRTGATGDATQPRSPPGAREGPGCHRGSPAPFSAKTRAGQAGGVGRRHPHSEEEARRGGDGEAGGTPSTGIPPPGWGGSSRDFGTAPGGGTTEQRPLCCRAPRRRRSCPAGRSPSHRPASAAPAERAAEGPWAGQGAGPPPAEPPGVPWLRGGQHLPGRSRTWRWRRGSARCRGRRRSRAGCSRGCAPGTRLGFSMRDGASCHPAHPTATPCPPPSHLPARC